MKLTIEKNFTRFLNTEIIRRGWKIIGLQFPTEYKHNVITVQLHRAKRIAISFILEVKRIAKKFLSPGFPRNFIRNTTEYFSKDKDDFIIPEWYLMNEIYLMHDCRFKSQMKNLPKALSKSSSYLQIINVNSTLLGTLTILIHSFKLKTISNTTSALFTKVIVSVVKTVLVNP